MNLRKTLTGIALTCLLVHPSLVLGEYNGSQIPIFFGARPDARTEASGGADIALGGSVTSGIYNPAGIGSIKGWAVSAALLDSNFPVNENTEFNYFGGAVRAERYGTFAISRYHYDYGTEITDSTGVHTPLSNLYSLTFATTLFGNVLGGCSLNLIEDKLTSEKTEYGAYIDLGVIESLELVRSRNTDQFLNLGACLSNAAFARIYSDEELPVILRLGLSYRLAWKKELLFPDLNVFEFILRGGYNGILNAPDSRHFRMGGEALIMELLALRYGYLGDKLAYGDFASEAEYEKIASFGIGLRLPLYKLILETLPLDIRLDMAWLELPDPHIQDDDHYTVTTLSVNLVH